MFIRFPPNYSFNCSVLTYIQRTDPRYPNSALVRCTASREPNRGISVNPFKVQCQQTERNKKKVYFAKIILIIILITITKERITDFKN